MKRYFKILSICIILGGIIAFLFYRDINNEVRAVVKKEEIVSLFQVGVFKNKENALKFAKSFNTFKVIESDNYYRVIIAVCFSDNVALKLESTFKDEGISYYIKEYRVSKDVVNSIKEFESVILKSNKKEVINSVINSMLKLI